MSARRAQTEPDAGRWAQLRDKRIDREHQQRPAAEPREDVRGDEAAYAWNEVEDDREEQLRREVPPHHN